MNPYEEEKIIATWCDQALKLMDRHNISQLPENYAVWFEYVRGSNKKLKSEIDKLLADKKPLTHEINRQLYHHHIVKDIDSRVIIEASARVQHVMANVLKAVEASNTNTANYNSELTSFSN